MKALEDDEIVDLYLSRNEDAIKFTAEKYGNKLRGLSMRITEDVQLAEECENDSYLEAWNHIPPNEPRTYFAQYLSRIVRNISINKCMERKRLKRNACIVELTAEMEECIPAPGSEADGISGDETGELISQFLRGLTKEKRLMFMQRYYFFEPVSSIAKRLGFSESKVKTTLFRIRKELREYLIKEGYTL